MNIRSSHVQIVQPNQKLGTIFSYTHQLHFTRACVVNILKKVRQIKGYFWFETQKSIADITKIISPMNSCTYTCIVCAVSYLRYMVDFSQQRTRVSATNACKVTPWISVYLCSLIIQPYWVRVFTSTTSCFHCELTWK